MDVILFLGLIAAWIWSVMRGMQVSFLCCVLNFTFPPVSQIIYSVYEQKMRLPLFAMLGIGVILFVLYGEVVIESNTPNTPSEEQI